MVTRAKKFTNHCFNLMFELLLQTCLCSSGWCTSFNFCRFMDHSYSKIKPPLLQSHGVRKVTHRWLTSSGRPFLTLVFSAWFLRSCVRLIFTSALVVHCLHWAQEEETDQDHRRFATFRCMCRSGTFAMYFVISVGEEQSLRPSLWWCNSQLATDTCAH